MGPLGTFGSRRDPRSGQEGRHIYFIDEGR